MTIRKDVGLRRRQAIDGAAAADSGRRAFDVAADKSSSTDAAAMSAYRFQAAPY